MPKTKRGPALFDLLARGADRAPEVLKLPRWWTRKDRAAEEPQSGLKLADEAVAPAGVAVTESIRSEIRAPFAELDGSLIRLSLTTLTAAIAVFGLAVVVGGAFVVGRGSGDRQGFKRGYDAGRALYAGGAAGEIDAARSQPPATHVVSGLLDEPKEAQAKPSREAQPKPAKEVPPKGGRETQPKSGKEAELKANSAASVVAPGSEGSAETRKVPWTRGHTYVVAQEFAAGKSDDAGRAREFLAQNGVDAEVVRPRNGAIQLITTQGYDRDNPTQREPADQLLKRVQSLGVKYSTAGGGYKLQGYFKTLKGDSW